MMRHHYIERRSFRTHRPLREANNITVYAGYFHDDYYDPIFSNDKDDVADYEYTAKISAPAGTYVMFRWNDEDCYFTKTVSPEEAIAQWTELFQEQYDNGDDCYYEEDMTGGTELYVEDYDSPEDAAKDLYEMVSSQEPDGDSNMGCIWQKIEEF